MATPLTLPPWIGLGVRGCSRRLIASDSIYLVVLDPSNYSKFIRLLLCEPPEPDALDLTMNSEAKSTGHIRSDPLVPSLSPSRRILNFDTMYRVEQLREPGVEVEESRVMRPRF